MRLPLSFGRLVASNLLAQSAEQVALAAVPIVAVLALGAGPGETGLLAGLQTLPFLLLSLPLGLVADRVARRKLMAGAELVRAAALAGVPLLAAGGLVSVPVLAALGFVAATGTVAYSVAAPSLVPALVPRAALGLANGRLELVRSIAFASGPALAGALVGWAGASLAFLLAVALSLGAAGCLSGLQEPTREPAARRSVLHDLREGAAFAWRHRLLRPILLTAVAWNVSWFVLQAVYMPYALTGLGLSSAEVGATLGAYGVGMVLGALLAPRLGRSLRFGSMVATGPFVSVAAALAMLGSLAVPGPVMPALSFLLFGAGPIVWTISQTTLRQAVTPEAMLGRVSALITMATFGARPIGAAIGGVVGAAFGPAPCLVLAALGFAVQAAVIAASPVPALRAIPA